MKQLPLLQPPPPPPVKPHPGVKTKRVAKRANTYKHHPHDKWVALGTKLLETDINESDLIRRFVEFLHKVLPQPTQKTTPQHHPPTEPRPKIEKLDIVVTPQ